MHYFDIPKIPFLHCQGCETPLITSPYLHHLHQKSMSSVYPPAKTVFLAFSFCAMEIMVVFSFFNDKNIMLNMFSQTTCCFHVPPGELDPL